MSQLPTSTPPTLGPATPGPFATSTPRPLGGAALAAIIGSAVVGLVYTGVLGALVALSIGAAVDASIDALPTDGPGVSEEPFGAVPDDDAPRDPLAGYPGYRMGDASLLLDQPTAEEAIALSETAVAAVRAALLDGWSAADDRYYEHTENAYGGTSLLYRYISETHYADADLSAAGDKQAAVDSFTAALAPLGFDAVEIADSPAEWSGVGYDLVGDLSDEEASASLWIVTASSTTQEVPAIELGLADLDADPTGEVRTMLEELGVTPSDAGAFLAGYANGVLEEGDRPEFTRRMAEFGGIATT